MAVPEHIRHTLASLRGELADLDQKLAEFTKLDARRSQVKAVIGNLEALYPRAAQPAPTTATTVRIAPTATMPDAAETVLRGLGRPLHIRSLIEAIQATGFHADRDFETMRTTLVSTLDRKVKAGQTFTKPEPGTYGLLEWRTEGHGAGNGNGQGVMTLDR